MRIVINNTAASSGGALSILKSFYNYLVNSDIAKEHEWIFLLSDKYIQETDNIKVVVLNEYKKNWLQRLKFDFYYGKYIISEIKPDIVFSLQNTIILGLKCKQVLYMHQSLPFQKIKRFSLFKPKERKLAIYQYFIGRLIKESIKRADKTIVQTDWIKNAVIETTGISPNKIMNILPPFENVSKFKRDHLLEVNRFFYPAESSIYKNHKCIYDAITILSKKDIKNFNVLLTINEVDKINNNVTYLGKIPYESVFENYNKSTLLFPSYIETVGLPLIEARSMGTIILAADCPFSREALYGYENAYFFDPFTPNQLAVLMERVVKGQIKKKSRFNENFYSENSWKYVLETFESLGGDKD